MESDDDYEQFMPPEESSTPPRNRKLKRLKKTIDLSKPPHSIPSVEFELKNADYSKTSDSTELDELLRSPSISEELNFERENELDAFDSLFSEEKRLAVKKGFGFDNTGEGFDGISDGLIGDVGGDMNLGKSKVDMKRPSSEGFSDQIEESKKKRSKSSRQCKEKKGTKRAAAADGKPKFSRRKENLEKKTQLVEYQRYLRERREVEFQPIPVVRKPISSVLEKIRHRKLEMSKKLRLRSMNKSHDPLRELTPDDDSDDAPVVEKLDSKHREVPGKPFAQAAVEGSALNTSSADRFDEDTSHSTNELASCPLLLAEKPSQAFQAPVSDTQDLCFDLQPGDTQDDQSNEDASNPPEDAAPSSFEMNLKLDSAHLDDISSDEDDDDKENIDPLLQQPFDENSCPDGDPVKAFLDEEAIEEDDSDSDLMCFQDDEDEVDPQDIDDIIATDYKEKPIDCERRSELHQMWLEQQDGAGTDNLLQRLNCNLNKEETILFNEEAGGDIDGQNDDSGSDVEKDLFPTKFAHFSTRKLKQMIPQMFTDKDDGFLSSDDEEIEKRLIKQCLLEKVELKENAAFVSPAEDETSREVFGRIKKLNILPETRKKANTSSFFDTLLVKGSSIGSEKSSFLNRASNHAASSTNRHGSSTARSSFIFARDDSNSRSSISVSEDSTDMCQKENQPKRNVSAKFTSSQAKVSIKRTEMADQRGHGTSLFEILRSSSIQSDLCTTDSTVDHQAVFAAFQSVKTSMKFERRS
ncbi:hypothetical protein Nepgr_005989 [Nepenthes gracilis]|uniref:Uncharacterized protein n=1 Tax=Nepenthes gracilis TaxID=150966 RepID=A0AAD3S486_NEPGR|nr:hypothetical protein Nepgr_005989 [Nepenthes gracilis]